MSGARAIGARGSRRALGEAGARPASCRPADVVFQVVQANLTTTGPVPAERAGRATRVVVVDDHAPLRRLIVDVLAEAEDIAVVGECTDGDEVVDLVLRTGPDVVVMDVSMPRVDGLEATRRLLAHRPRTRVLLLSAPLGTDRSQEAHDVGAVGFLSKQDILALPDGVRQVAHGATAWSYRHSPGDAAGVAGRDRRSPSRAGSGPRRGAVP